MKFIIFSTTKLQRKYYTTYKIIQLLKLLTPQQIRHATLKLSQKEVKAIGQGKLPNWWVHLFLADFSQRVTS